MKLLQKKWRQGVYRSALALVLLCFALLPGMSAYAATAAKEYQIKAVYLFNVVTFIQWPKNLYGARGNKFRLCILGTDPFGTLLKVVTRREKIAGRAIVISRLQSVEEAGECNTIFVSRSEKHQITHILDNVPKYALTVSDNDAFVRQGGMVELYTNRRRQVKLAVAPTNMEAGGLSVSSKLLKISTIVDATR